MVTALLLAALAMPVASFLVLKSRFRAHGLVAAAVAVATGWALGVAWAFAGRGLSAEDPSQANQDTVAIAATFGWVCPTVLVLVTWLIWRRVTRRAG